jgi:hypothetical protein
LLLAVCAARHYGWKLSPGDWQADAWNILGAAAIVTLAWRLLAADQTRAGAWCFAALAVHELLVAGCSAAWLAWGPWTVPPGVSQCSAAIGFDADKLAAVVVMLALVRAVTPVRIDR